MRLATCLALAALLSASACSADDGSSGATTTTADADADAGWTPPTCERPAAEVPDAATVAGAANDLDVTSFDGTVIRAHWFPVGGASAPTVLMGPGWGMAGDTNTTATDVPTEMSVLTIPGLHGAGYNVLTWDPRGFGESTGTVTIDSVDHEARDVSVLLDWVAAQPEVQLDAPGDPRVGMVGASYGGGIQLVTAASDCRVDAITPTIAWNSLGTSLYPNETYKAGWGDLLVQAASAAELDPHIVAARDAAAEQGRLDEEQLDWFLARGPDGLLDQVQVPTLVIQGNVDNLFTLQEADANVRALLANDVPVASLWYCGGHGACLTEADPAGLVPDAVRAWLDRWVKGDQGVGLPPPFQTVDQHGTVHPFDAYPVPTGDPVVASGEGELRLQADGGSGPVTEGLPDDVVARVAGGITPARATHAAEVTITNGDGERLLLGAPVLSLTYAGDAPAEGSLPTRIFAQLVDDATGIVVGNQITPVPVVLDGDRHTVELPLEMIAFLAEPGATLTLQLVATTVAYAVPQLGSTVRFESIEVSLPTAGG